MYQHLTKLILARVVAALCAILAVTTLGATAVGAQSSKITVHRGSDTHTVELDSQGNALAPKLRILRVPQVPTETATQANTRKQVTGVDGLVPLSVAGQTLWLNGESGSGLIACRLVWATVRRGRGHWITRCYNENGGVTRPGKLSRSRLPRAGLLVRIRSAGRY